MVNTRNTKRKSPPAKASDDAKKASAKRSHHETSGSSDESKIVMTPRENDFNVKTWWMVDLTPIGESSSQGASALVKRCMRTYSWDEAKARKVLDAYRQFIILKKNLEDWKAEILSPCYLVDQMWHCHILDVVNYYHDMMLLCGHVVGHDPDGALDYAAKQKRDDTTHKSLQEHFGSYDVEVWDYSPDAATENVKDDDANKLKDTDNEEEESAISDTITIRINDQSGGETMFKIKKSTQMSKVFNAFATKKGIHVEDLRFLLDGYPMWGGTPRSYDLEDGDRIDVFLAQSGC